MLTCDDFPAFFFEVYGFAPFDWQDQLCRRVIEGGGWPPALDVPTGMGKTAVLDIAIFSLAVDAEANGHRRTLPLRTFLCVDRRLLVDQAHDRACKLKAILEEPGRERPIVGRVSEVLRGLQATRVAGSADQGALAVARLRGGTSWRSQWLNRPDMPALVSATIDQLGSRLLFRGYGLRDQRKPIDAALVGNDSLILLDEAHLARPFVTTLDAAGAYESRLVERTVGRAATIVSLSATLHEAGDRTFVFDEDAEHSERARRRYRAVKPTRLVDLAGVKADDKGLVRLAQTLIESALIAVAEGARSVGVVVNRVDLARLVFDRLRGDGEAEIDTVLVIGRCRQWEKEKGGIVMTRLDPIRSDRRDPSGVQHLLRPTVFVATQTIEVGADLDFDALVTEAAPFDALAQRLGRLDRLGEAAAPVTAVVVHTDAFHADHPLYGRAAQHTWDWLCGQAGGYATVAKAVDLRASLAGAPTVDLGPARLRELATPEARSDLSAAPPATPVLLVDHLDRWSRTSPIPVPDQPVGPFLHGVARPSGVVSVVWRAGLAHRTEAWDTELLNAPLRALEQVDVPIGAVRCFLEGRAPRGGSDLDYGVDDTEEGDPLEERQLVDAFAPSLDPDGGVVHVDADHLRAGMVILLHAEDGGHDSWGWSGVKGAVVPDVADLGVVDGPGPRRLRIRDGVLGLDRTDGDSLKAQVRRIAEAARSGDDTNTDTGRLLHFMAGRLSGLEGREADDRRRLVEDAINNLAHVRVNFVFDVGSEVSGCVLRWPSGGASSAEALGEAIDDVTSSFTRRQVELRDHLLGVAARAEAFGRAASLDEDLLAATELAARAHDLGKADRRFQVMLHGGDPLVADADGRVLAKSALDASRWKAARKAAGWPRGLRHEAISGALVRQLGDTAVGVDRELVEHLIVTHHGHGRPLFPAVADGHGGVEADLPRPDGTSVRLSAASDALGIGWDQAARLRRLCRRYGWWGLAMLETVVRLADVTCSEEGG